MRVNEAIHEEQPILYQSPTSTWRDLMIKLILGNPDNSHVPGSAAARSRIGETRIRECETRNGSMCIPHTALSCC